VTLCELCSARKAVYLLTVAKILRTANGNQSQHVPFGETWKFGICESCLPFQKVREVTETIQIRKMRQIPLGGGK
jgi:hypothetical protein